MFGPSIDCPFCDWVMAAILILMGGLIVACVIGAAILWWAT